MNKSPKMYIIKKLLSTANPDMNREIEKIGTLVENRVIPLPMRAIILEKISTGRRPIESANEPNTCVPTTEPTKNIDCPIVDFHAESHTQFNYWRKQLISIRNRIKIIVCVCVSHTSDILHCSCSYSHGPIHKSSDRSTEFYCCNMLRDNWMMSD